MTKKKAAESKARQVQRASVKRTQNASKRNTRRAPAARPAPQPELPPAPPLPFGRWFAVLLGGMAIVALVIVGLQNAPAWLAALNGRDGESGALAAPAVAPTDDPNRIGIVSGHRGNDSGTVCADGLTEAQVNFDHATRVASFLRADGYTVDILDEFDPRLKGYKAKLLLSIHADSCTYVNDLATGFKVARASASPNPEASDTLVACLTEHYGEATGLRFHRNTVTRDMTEYHGFNELDPSTPAAIIETGFMYLDRPILTQKPEVVATAITDGILCFLKRAPAAVTPAP